MNWKSLLALFMLFLYPLCIRAQNLVPNPSFEAYNNCPNDTVFITGVGSPSNIAYSPGYDIFPTVKAWVSPNKSSPDYFNSCNTIYCDRSVPYNSFGYQHPRTGNAYSGMFMYNYAQSAVKDYREYIEAKLLQPLVGGHTYNVSFYVSLAAFLCGSGTMISVDRIGAYFSDTMLYQDTLYIPNLYITLAPSIESAPGWFISDTVNWTKIEGTYTAHGGEQWITLGHFNDAPLHDSVLYSIVVGFPNDSFLSCYMYMDDVCVMDMTNNTNSSTVCTATLPVSISGINDTGTYLWNTGDTTATLTVNKAGTYWRVVKGDCLYYTDTITVTQKPYVHLGNDTAVCKEALLTLNGQEDGVNYLWSTGDTTCCITPEVSGVYILQASNACGTAQDSILVNVFYPCEQCLFVPTAFTPNGDGRNDLFEIKARCPMKDYHLRVYDRYGQLVFSSVQIDYSWNGEYKGSPMDVGVYYYYIEYTPALPAATKQIIKGNVTLVK